MRQQSLRMPPERILEGALLFFDHAYVVGVCALRRMENSRVEDGVTLRPVDASNAPKRDLENCTNRSFHSVHTIIFR